MSASLQRLYGVPELFGFGVFPFRVSSVIRIQMQPELRQGEAFFDLSGSAGVRRLRIPASDNPFGDVGPWLLGVL